MDLAITLLWGITSITARVKDSPQLAAESFNARSNMLLLDSIFPVHAACGCLP